ncbi:hypothetical protein MSPP1_002246 [Malassezia sp. CBS 17886]|nr:hypothetical protein MSPP1_002246 [Malassezia sp. CBS 17886]
MDVPVVMAPPPPPIPFSAALPLPHNTAPVSFGFGCGSSFGGNNALGGMDVRAPMPVFPHVFAPAPALPLSPTTLRQAHLPHELHTQQSRGVSKRRRSGSADDQAPASPEAHAGYAAGDIADDDMATSPVLEAKRRRGSQPRHLPRGADASSGSRSDAPRTPLGADLGRMLACLDTPALLSVLHELAKDASLAERIYALLPTPSLESVEAQLDASEARVRAAMGISASGAAAAAPHLPTTMSSMREPYIWGRVRGPLAELVREVNSLIPLFSIVGAGACREAVHPATAFSFLYSVTASMLRIERLLPRAIPEVFSGGAEGARAPPDGALPSLLRDTLPESHTSPASPDAITSAVMPAVVREWERWLLAVDTAVNTEGRMYGQEVVAGWGRALRALGSAEDGAGRSAAERAIRGVLDQVAARMYETIGWLTGPAHRMPWALAGPGGMHAMDADDGR